MPAVKRLAALCLVLLLHGCGATLLRSDCDSPRVSNIMAPSSYLVVLPYRYRGSDKQPEQVAVVDQIVALQAMRIAADMDGTHITLIEGAPGDPACGIERVYERVVDKRSGLFWRRVFHSAIFIWGEVYDAPDGLMVQTHLRAYWNGRADKELSVLVDQPYLVRPLRFTGELPSGSISFPPRRLLSAEQRAATQALRSLEVREAPDDAAAMGVMPRKFTVGHWRAPWLELTDLHGRAMWVKVPEVFGISAGLLPELSFARALTAYLNHRVDRADEQRAEVGRALDAFRQGYPDLSDPLLREVLAVADVLEGTLGLTMIQQSGELVSSPGSDASQRALADAAAALPLRADLLNLSAMARIPGCCALNDGARQAAIQRDLEQAYQLDPADGRIADNLLSWYELMVRMPAQRSWATSAELERRRSSLRRVLGDGPTLLERLQP